MYFRNLLDSLNIPYSLVGAATTTKFPVTIGDRRILIDFSDHTDYLGNWDSFDAYFKYHYSYAAHGGCSTIYPFAPISFYDWNQYRDLAKKIKYACVSNTILNMQRPYAGALERRTLVQKMLKSKYRKDVIVNLIDQIDFWKKINDCLVHVFVPGARPNMIDRGIFQYMFFGCCCITTYIPETLPYNQMFIPGKDYVICKNDYSDLCDRIEWVRSNRKKAVEIGNRAKRKCLSYFTPAKLWDWVIQNVNL